MQRPQQTLAGFEGGGSVRGDEACGQRLEAGKHQEAPS